MVTAVVSVAGALSGPLGGSQSGPVSGAANGPLGASPGTQGATTGRDESEFAQLLEGMDGDTASSLPQTGVTPIKSAFAEADTVVDGGGLSAEMLAMCAIPMAPITSTSIPTQAAIPALIAATTGPQTTTGATAIDMLTARTAVNALPAAATPIPPGNSASIATAAIQSDASTPVALANTSTVASDAGVDTKAVAASQTGAGRDVVAGSDTDATGVLTTQDMQWLRSGNQSTAGDAKSVRQTSGLKAAPAATNVALATSANVTSTTPSPIGGTQSSHEDIYQQLLTQTAPMVAVANGQRYEREIEAARADSSTATVDTASALNSYAAQPAGTQLATDASAFDVSLRHQVHAAVGSHQWATELGNKLTMMASKDTQSATLYMTPADLGPVQVRIDLHQNQASVWFTAEHADTRSALEQSLPRLREMFTAQGMSLTDAGVFGDRSRQQQTYSGAESGNAPGMRFSGDEGSEGIASVRGISLSLLDAYA